jgi:hypothetical protein
MKEILQFVRTYILFVSFILIGCNDTRYSLNDINKQRSVIKQFKNNKPEYNGYSKEECLVGMFQSIQDYDYFVKLAIINTKDGIPRVTSNALSVIELDKKYGDVYGLTLGFPQIKKLGKAVNDVMDEKIFKETFFEIKGCNLAMVGIRKNKIVQLIKKCEYDLWMKNNPTAKIIKL